ncbi:MAG: hypothetical protein K9J13_03845 [Saprospiraceae bacterium]|nr:hypothetical protein [Saprospiraceae bacterium]
MNSKNSILIVIIALLLCYCNYTHADDYDFSFCYDFDDSLSDITWIKSIAYAKASQIYFNYAENIPWTLYQKMIFDNIINEDNALLLFDTVTDASKPGSVKFLSAYSRKMVISKLYQVQYRPDIYKEYSIINENIRFKVRHSEYSSLNKQEIDDLRISILKLQYLQYLSVNKFRKCQIILEQIHRLDPESEFYYQNNLKISMEIADSPAASHIIELSIENNIDIPPFMLGDYYFYINEPKLSSKAFQDAIKNNERDYNSRLGMIKILIQENRINRASKYTNQLITDFPYEIEPLFRYAQCYKIKDNVPLAIDYIERSIAIDSLDARLYMINYKFENIAKDKKFPTDEYLLYLEELDLKFPDNPFIYQEYFLCYFFSDESDLYPKLKLDNMSKMNLTPLQLFIYNINKYKIDNIIDVDYILNGLDIYDFNLKFLFATWLFQKGIYDYTIYIVSDIIKVYPDNVTLLKILLESYRRLGKLNSVENLFQKLLESASRDYYTSFLKSEMKDNSNENLLDYYYSRAKRKKDNDLWLYDKKELSHYINSLLLTQLIDIDNINIENRFFRNLVEEYK